MFGADRDRVIAEHLAWIELREARAAIERPADYPLAQFAREHSARLAAARAAAEGYYRNTKPRPRGRR